MKKRRPITETKTKVFKSRLTGSNLISDFHVRLKRGGNLDGLEEYQLASIKGAKKAKKEIVGQWVVPFLSPSQGCSGCGFLQGELREKIRLLDVGALNGKAYTKFRHIQTTSIDLHPMDPSVKKQDFFERPIPKECQIKHDTHIPGDIQDFFDVISLSLVINFVPNASQRGKMLRHALFFLPKLTGGYVYIVLPLKCMTNSRYWNHELFIECMSHLYCTLTQFHHSQKLAFYLFHWKGVEDYSMIEQAKFPKKLVNDGPGKNNFCIKLE